MNIRKQPSGVGAVAIESASESAVRGPRKTNNITYDLKLPADATAACEVAAL